MVGMVGKGDNRLSTFADQLMANDPQQRPSLLEWHEQFDGESMKPPVAKKPRLAG